MLSKSQNNHDVIDSLQLSLNFNWCLLVIMLSKFNEHNLYWKGVTLFFSDDVTERLHYPLKKSQVIQLLLLMTSLSVSITPLKSLKWFNSFRFTCCSNLVAIRHMQVEMPPSRFIRWIFWNKLNAPYLKNDRWNVLIEISDKIFQTHIKDSTDHLS